MLALLKLALPAVLSYSHRRPLALCYLLHCLTDDDIIDSDCSYTCPLAHALLDLAPPGGLRDD